MNITDYLSNLKTKSDSIFEKSIKFTAQLGEAHHIAACVYEFAENVNDNSERNILIMVSSQLESATLNATLGMYRQAFSSLRLALEMGLGAAYFSIHKLELQEWLIGKTDIKWSSLIDENDGVLSKRFSKGFFEEFSVDIFDYNDNAKDLYRKLSEYVHGSNETWIKSGLTLNYNEDLLKSYFESINKVAKIILYILSCRYLKSFSPSTLESLEFIPQEMNHIPYIREFFGGPKA